MKICLAMAISVLTAAVLLIFLPVHGEEAVYDSVIRLHVLAVSDSAQDQAVKLSVRDHVLDRLTPMLAEVDTKGHAEQTIRNHLTALEQDTAAWLAEQGMTVPVRFSFDNEKYPTRVYDDFTLPAGEYMSLRVVLGEGEGKNWWCVLFPSVCSRFAMTSPEEVYKEAGFTPEQYRLITHTDKVQYKVRFRLLEIFMELLEKEA